MFALDDGGVGLVIGDVVGHDIAAAAAMSKVQSTLRAIAWSGGRPCDVLDDLEGLIATFEITELVTVFYGVLDLPDHEGQRTLTYANAGHLPPFMRDADGHVEALTAGSSVLLGAPTSPGASRPQARHVLGPGSLLLLFTDGLVEVPGTSLTESLARVQIMIADSPGGADASCDLVLAHIDSGRLRDDVAVLAVHLNEAPLLASRPESKESRGTARGVDDLVTPSL